MGRKYPRRVAIGNCTLYLGDCLDVLRELPCTPRDALVTDPPYGTTDNAWDQAPPLDYWWRLCWAHLKRPAIAAVFSQQLFSTDLIASARRAWRAELIWAKPRPVGFLSAKLRPLRCHEHIQIFCRCMGRSTYHPQMTAGKPYKASGCKHRASSNWGRYNPGRRGADNAGTRYPRSVLSFAHDQGDGINHPTRKPLALVEWLVRTYTNAGETVLDPYMGSGTTGADCIRNGRRFVGIERNPEYFAMACRRLRAEWRQHKERTNGRS